MDNMDKNKLIAALKEVVSSTQLTVYHGSNKKIDKFKSGVETYRRLLFKEFRQISQGIFFSFSAKDARLYGRNLYKVTLDNPKLFISTKDITVDRLDPKREHQLAEMLLSIAKDTRKGKIINLYHSDIYVPEDFDPGKQEVSNWDWIYWVVGNGIVWDVLDEPNFVKKLLAFGYDGTVVDENNPELKDKKSIFIARLEKIGDIEQVFDDEDDEDDEDDIEGEEH